MSRPLLPALAVASGWMIAIVAGTAWAWGDTDRIASVLFALALVGMLTLLALVLEGWREDGLLGVAYRVRHPLGTALVGDDARSPWVLAFAIGLLAASGAAGILWSTSPRPLTWKQVFQLSPSGRAP